jgi:hypothetical protein
MVVALLQVVTWYSVAIGDANSINDITDDALLLSVSSQNFKFNFPNESIFCILAQFN